jgi:hypothetical protein
MDSRTSFSSKADVLQALSRHEFLHIPKVHVFTVEQWRSDEKGVLREISHNFDKEETAVIRSSCRREDSESASAAGAYLSVLDVDASAKQSLKDAIERVIASYGDAMPEDQVLVQPMLRQVIVTGVIMTRVLTDGTPYYVINYDDESGKTDTITGGRNVSKTVYVYRDVRDQNFDSSRLRGFVELARRLEDLCGSDALDIEFCLDVENVLHLLQVRPICTQRHWPEPAHTITGFIGHVADFVAAKTGPSQKLFGRRSILGVMPDWNPAEMIGILPRPLATSLYRNLITARVWSTARKRMGYRAVPTELMLLLLGRPYIDVRASFNSFLPNGLDPVTCEALVSAWLERLEAQPQLHDKIEFEVAQTVMDFCFDAHLDERYPGLLTTSRREDFRTSLRRLTLHCLDDSSTSSMNRAFDAVTELRNRQAGRPLFSAAHPLPLSAINGLLEECRKYGTLPFSILARHAFIAESLLRTATTRGALSPERLQDFKLSIKTISGELSAEFLEVCRGYRDALNFMQKYGHLRPGSYDILSPRYADRDSLFGDSQAVMFTDQPVRHFQLTGKEKSGIQQLLAESCLSVTPEHLFRYARQAIVGRELAKFIFSRNLSDVLEIVACWGEELGFGRDDLSFMDIQAILDMATYVRPESPKEHFEKHIALNRAIFEKAESIKLGYIIRSVRDVYVVPQHRAAPNYIGTRHTEGPVIRLFADSPCSLELSGKIVCIENADPGFDWIFTRNIAALVTKFGGANSHMAIRCAEYGLPAAIGVGEHLFEAVCGGGTAFIDPRAAVLKPQ